MDTLIIRTENSIYELTVISHHTAEILVRGGKFFPEFCPARLAGASFGGSFLKMRGIYVGFRMELYWKEGRIITSRVQTIALRADSKSAPISKLS